MQTNEQIHILGGGVSGLAAGHFCQRAGIPRTVFEAGSDVGGNARTLELDGFRFDTGAHRFHGLEPASTAEAFALLGNELKEVTAPSRIWDHGRFIDFPLRAGDLLSHLGPFFCAYAGMALVAGRTRPRRNNPDFESLAVRTYGRVVAERFLLQYSEKLWGAPCRQLSPLVAGRRLRGLSLRRFVMEAIRGPGERRGTFEGSFFYPDGGIGRIADALADSCGRQNIRTRTRVTRLRHDGQRVRQLELGGPDGPEVWSSERVISTIPVSILISLLDPPAPPELLDDARALRFRDVLLAVFLIDRPSINDCATMYFPGSDTPVTRVYEPRNRSELMAPPGKTSLVAEIPIPSTQRDTEAEEAAAEDLLYRCGWINRRDLIGQTTHRLRHAYPVLELGVEERVARMLEYVERFENLRTIGRGGTFTYTHLHDQIRVARELMAAWAEEVDSVWRPLSRGARVESDVLASDVDAGGPGRADASAER